MSIGIDLTRNQIKLARRMRAAEISWGDISKMFGLGLFVLRRNVDPAWAERHREQSRQWDRNRPPRPHSLKVYVSPFRPTEDEYRAARKALPKDTRSLTGRLCGDPLPGRSALDKRGATSAVNYPLWKAGIGGITSQVTDI